MNEIPRRPIEPLAPPPGSFDAVVKRARYRRHRRTTTVLSVAVVFLAGIGGGMSLDGVSGVRQTLGLAADDTVATAEPTNSAVATPQVSAPDETMRRSPTKAQAESPKVVVPPRGSRKVSGIAVSAEGAPIAGLYVYPGRSGTDGFQATREPVTRTAADGSFSLACPGTPVLLSPWRVNVAGDEHEPGGAWSATFVGGTTQAASAADAPCSTSRRAVKTTVLPGSTLTGTVTMPEQCADAELPLWIWLNGNRALTVRLGGLGSGDSFSVSGLPPGQHTIGANGNRTTVTVGGGGSFTQDVTFDCDSGSGSGTETPDPSPTPSTPLPTPSDPPTSQPSPSSTTPTGSSSASTSTGTASSAP